MSTLVGFKKFTGKKDGTKYCVLQVVGEFNSREKNSGCAGKKVEEVFAPADKVDSINETLIGKEVKLEYELSGNRAYLVDVTFSDKAR